MSLCIISKKNPGTHLYMHKTLCPLAERQAIVLISFKTYFYYEVLQVWVRTVGPSALHVFRCQSAFVYWWKQGGTCKPSKTYSHSVSCLVWLHLSKTKIHWSIHKRHNMSVLDLYVPVGNFNLTDSHYFMARALKRLFNEPSVKIMK